MAKNSRRIAAAIESCMPELIKLDQMPPLKSLALTIFFDEKGDFTNVTPRFDVKTDKANLTAPAQPSP